MFSPAPPSSAAASVNSPNNQSKPRLSALLAASANNGSSVGASLNAGASGGGPSISHETFGAIGNREDFEQTEKNNRLFGIVMDDAEVLESLYENLKFAIVSKRDQAMQKNDKNDQNVTNVVRQWKWTKPLLWDFEKLVREYGFNLSPYEIQMHHEFVDFSFDEPEQALTSLVNAKSSMSKARLAGVREELRDLDKQYLGEAGAPMSKHCVALFELAHTDVLSHARLELQKSDSHIAQLENQIEVDRQLRDAAIARGDIPSVEPPHCNMIKNYVELLELISKRIVDLTATDDETNVFRKNCAEVVTGARAVAKRLGDENRGLQNRCLADIRRSEAVRVDEGARDAEATSNHKEFIVDVREHLEKNQQRQKVVLDQIAELTKELFTLTDERKDILSRLCEEKEVEERRSANFEEFSIVRAEHLPYVDRIRDLTDRRLGAEQGLTDYINEMQRRYEEMDIEGMLDELVEPELRKYIATYRGLVYAVGELMTKKSLRVENLLRQRRQLKLQQELAVSSLDHEMGTYVKKHDELTKQLNQAQTDLAFLQHTQNVGEKNYAQLSALQQRFNLQCLHPLVEYAGQSAEDRQKFADAATRYVDDENVELDKSKQHVRQLIAMNEVEKAQTPSLASAAAFSARGGGRSVGMGSSNNNNNNYAPGMSSRRSISNSGMGNSFNNNNNGGGSRPGTGSSYNNNVRPQSAGNISSSLPHRVNDEDEFPMPQPQKQQHDDARNRPITLDDSEEDDGPQQQQPNEDAPSSQRLMQNELMEEDM